MTMRHYYCETAAEDLIIRRIAHCPLFRTSWGSMLFSNPVSVNWRRPHDRAQKPAKKSLMQPISSSSSTMVEGPTGPAINLIFATSENMWCRFAAQGRVAQMVRLAPTDNTLKKIDGKKAARLGRRRAGGYMVTLRTLIEGYRDPLQHQTTS